MNKINKHVYKQQYSDDDCLLVLDSVLKLVEDYRPLLATFANLKSVNM